MDLDGRSQLCVNFSKMPGYEICVSLPLKVGNQLPDGESADQLRTRSSTFFISHVPLLVHATKCFVARLCNWSNELALGGYGSFVNSLAVTHSK